MWLLDGNLLVALAIDSHEFHDRTQRWFDSETGPFATCAITEGTLLRVHMMVAQDTSASLRGLYLKRFTACRIMFSGTMALAIDRFPLRIYPGRNKSQMRGFPN
jgi:hypothetical protein